MDGEGFTPGVAFTPGFTGEDAAFAPVWENVDCLESPKAGGYEDAAFAPVLGNVDCLESPKAGGYEARDADAVPDCEFGGGWRGRGCRRIPGAVGAPSGGCDDVLARVG